MRPTRDADDRGASHLAARIGTASILAAEGTEPGPCRQGRPRLPQDIRGRAAPAGDAANPNDAAVQQAIAHKGIWVEPELLAEVEYGAKSSGQGTASHLQGIARGFMKAPRILLLELAMEYLPRHPDRFLRKTFQLRNARTARDFLRTASWADTSRRSLNDSVGFLTAESHSAKRLLPTAD
jgi:hypothetical protein